MCSYRRPTRAALSLSRVKYDFGVRLDGIHHVTCITGDAPRNVEYYTGVLGLRLVKKSVNQDDPTVYHLFYADKNGRPGRTSRSSSTHSPRRARRRDDPHRRLAGRFRGGDRVLAPRAGSVPFTDPNGLRHDLVVADVPDAPLIADHPEIPREMALQGFEGVRAYGEEPTAFLEALGFEDGLTRGDSRQGWIAYEPAPELPGVGGSGTVHHVAWACELGEEEAWIERVRPRAAGRRR